MPFKKGQIPPGAILFKPGVSGNPKGQPLKLVSYVNRELATEGYKPVTNREVINAFQTLINLPLEKIAAIANGSGYPILYRLVAKELHGKRGADYLEKLLDRAYGKAKQAMELTGADGEAIQINIIMPKDETP